MIYHDKYHEKSFWNLRSANLIIKNLPSRVIFNLLFSDGFIYMTNPGTQGTNRSQIWWANNHGNSLSQRWSSTLSDNEEGYFWPRNRAKSTLLRYHLKYCSIVAINCYHDCWPTKFVTY